MKNKAYLKQSAAEKYDIKEASNQNLSAKERQDYARNAQYDSKNFAQKIDGDMGSFDVMSEPAPVMSRSANKVNHIAAGRSKFMQAEDKKPSTMTIKEGEKPPKGFKVDHPATNHAKIEVKKDNMAIDAANKEARDAARRFRVSQGLSNFRQDKGNNPFSGFENDRPKPKKQKKTKKSNKKK